MKPWHLTLALLAALSVPACESEGENEEGPNVDCSTATVKKFSEITAWGKCTACHNSALADSARMPGTEGINFDDYASAKANAQKAMDEVYEGGMPLPGSPALSEDEKTQIYNWASCDTPN